MDNLGKRTLQVGITLGAIVGLVGCGAQADGTGADIQGVTPEAIQSGQNGLSMINGLSMVNGLSMSNGFAMANGLSMSNGLTMTNGLAMSNGLMTTSDGRRAVSYLVKCALASTDSLTKQDQNGVSYTFPGGLGLCPAWKNGGVSGDASCQERVSACMLALINVSGVHVPLMLDASYSSVGWGYNPAYPYQEGTYFGNIMQANAHGISGINAYYCEGPDFAAGVVPGRIGAGYSGAPYKAGFSVNSNRCDLNCSTGSAPRTNGSRYDGYDACNGWNNTITVYRQGSYTPVFDNGYNYQFANVAGGAGALQANNNNGSYTISAPQPGQMNTTPAQLFKVTTVSGNIVQLQVKGDTSKCFDVPNASNGSTSVSIASCNGTTSQQWIATADTKGHFLLQNNATSGSSAKYLTLNGSTLDIEALNIYYTDPQAWKLGAVDLQ